MLFPCASSLLARSSLQLAPVCSHALLSGCLGVISRRAAATLGAGPTTAADATAARLTPTPTEPLPASSSQQPGGSEQVLGVLSSLLQAQQQQQSVTPPPPPRHTPAAAAAAAFDSLQTQAAACQPDSSAASSGVVRMESQILFDSCWRRFKEKHSMDFAAPREIVWLNGAPGSGKGVSTPHILRVRGMTHAVCMSSLLASAPEAKRFIEAGEMIADATVGDLLLEALLQPASAGLSTPDLNAVVDGFPRTAVQVDFVKLLLEKLTRLHTKFVDTPLASRFPRPAFKVVVLYVDEATSIQRQLQRAVAARAHNARILDAGVGEQARLHQERATDLDLRKAASRYQLFKSHYSAILRLKQFLPFHLIDAMSSVQDTHEQITQELRYQSSLDLSEDAYSAIRHLPHAKDLQQTARQQLVSRLEGYCSQQRPLFGRVLALMSSEVLPLLQQGALAGAAEWVSHEPLFASHPAAIDMVLDVLSDRGFRATYVREALAVPVALDAASGAISSRLAPQHRFRFGYAHEGGRDSAMLKALEIAARITEAARGNIAAQAQAQQAQQPASTLPAAAGGGSGAGAASSGHAVHHAAAHLLHHPFAATKVTESFIPKHLDHEAKAREARAAAAAAAQQAGLKRVSLAAQGQAAAAAAAAIAAKASSSTSSQSCAACGSSDPATAAAAGGDGGVFVIHSCTRPDLLCGHSRELEVTAGN